MYTIRQALEQSVPEARELKLFKQLARRYSPSELRAICAGSAIAAPIQVMKPVHDFTGKLVRIGVMSDTHFGSIYTERGMVREAFKQFRKAKVDMILVAGDIHDGFKPGRHGSIYECSHIGYSAQLQYSKQVFGEWTDSPVYVIDGNHDRYFMEVGADIVPELCDALPNMEYVGRDSGVIKLGPHTNVMLWHGEDGSSYAFSYRLQKLVESLPGGKKPNIIVAGHVHKAGYFFIRNIHCIGAGSIQMQTRWMRSKRLEAHPGFWVIAVTVNSKGVGLLNSTFYPFYQ